MMPFQLPVVDDDIDDEKNFWWFIDMPVSVQDVDDVASLSLSNDVVLQNTLLVKGECWNIVTAKSILFIIELLFIRSIPFYGLITSGIVIDQIPFCGFVKP